jgi:hypothetical protein
MKVRQIYLEADGLTLEAAKSADWRAIPPAQRLYHAGEKRPAGIVVISSRYEDRVSSNNPSSCNTW